MSLPDPVDPVTGGPALPGYPMYGPDQQPGYPAQQPGYSPPPAYPAPGYPVAYGPHHGGQPPVLSFGDMVVTRDEVIVPHGRFPLRGTMWTVQDQSRVIENIPAYAIVLAILFFFVCLLGLLFLLIKERQVTGFVTVSVMGEGWYHAVQIPAHSSTMATIGQQVNVARSMAAVA